MSGEPAAGRRPRDSSHSRPPQGSAKRGRPASKARTSCPVCKNAWKWCSVACAGRADAGRAATGEATPGPGAAPEPGDPAHTAEGVRAHGLAGGVGVLLRVAAQGAVDAGEAVTPEPGDPAHTAEGVRAHGLAGGVGVLPRVAAQGAVDAGEAVTPDARGQADDGRAGVADGCQPGSQAARRDAALGRVVVEQGADRVQEAGMLRRSQREGRGRARPRLGEDAASEDATVGEQVTQILDGGRRIRSVGVERGRARRRLGDELNVDDGEGGAGNDGAASNSQAAGPRAERAPNKPRSWLPALSRCWVAASSVRDIVCGLDWERIRVHYDVIVRAQAVGILGTSRRAVLDSHFYSGLFDPVFLQPVT